MGLLKNIFYGKDDEHQKTDENIKNNKIIISSIDEIATINNGQNNIKEESIGEKKEYCLPSLDLLNDDSSKELIPFIDNIKKNTELFIPIGKCNNDILIESISNMPNLLIGGTVMSGKSTYINLILISMLLTRKPNDLKLIIFDSKGIEYLQYNGIPHLLMPIISDESHLLLSLKKVGYEIRRRYDLLKDFCKKSIRQYNNDLGNNIGKIPDLVIIIDSYADLNSTTEINDYIEYISKNGWNVNVYLIVVANHPSSKIISTVSKSNFPTRISFRVTSKKDSMIILDEPGAEKIKEVGTALYSSRFSNVLKTVKIPIINDAEIKHLIDYTIAQQRTKYDDAFMSSQINYASQSLGQQEEYDDPLYSDIVEFVVESGKVSASLLQRRFKLGYNRAARIIDLLEERGIIGPPDGSNPREVLVMLENNEGR